MNTLASRSAERDHLAEDAHPVGTIQDVLSALSDPIRLEMVRRLAHEGGPVPCGRLYSGIGKSTASHHFKILRAAGVTSRRTIDGQVHQQLEAGTVDARYPGLLDSVIRAVGGAA
ncbi:MAG: ArsR/SmtB family transcription factor [Mycobacteriales bacterium]